MMQRTRDALPPTLSQPGRIIRRQSTFWDLSGPNDEPGHITRVHFIQRAESRFVEPTFVHASVETQHPLLADYGATWGSLYVSRPAPTPTAAITQLSEMIYASSLGWRRLPRYQNALCDPRTVIATGLGLVLTAPLGLATRALAVLAAQGCHPTLTESQRGSTEARVLLLGANFVVAAHFDFQPLPSLR